MSRYLPALIAKLTDEELAERIEACQSWSCYDEELVNALAEELYQRETRGGARTSVAYQCGRRLARNYLNGRAADVEETGRVLRGLTAGRSDDYRVLLGFTEAVAESRGSYQADLRSLVGAR